MKLDTLAKLALVAAVLAPLSSNNSPRNHEETGKPEVSAIREKTAAQAIELFDHSTVSHLETQAYEYQNEKNFAAAAAMWQKLRFFCRLQVQRGTPYQEAYDSESRRAEGNRDACLSKLSLKEREIALMEILNMDFWPGT
jgi:hypothetical protein